MNNRTINGRGSGEGARDRLADIASQLSPIESNDGRMAYATLLLGWILRGDTEDDRYARAQSVERAWRSHHRDRFANRAPGAPVDLINPFPDFIAEAETILKFIGGES